MNLEFAWNPRKVASNVQKHGVAFEEAVTAFADPHSITIPTRTIQQEGCASS